MQEKIQSDPKEIIVNEYLTTNISIDELSHKYHISNRSIKNAAIKYLIAEKNIYKTLIYNQKELIKYTGFTIEQLESIYNLFVNNNWNITFDNEEILKYDIELHKLQTYAHLYKKFIVNKSNELFNANNVRCYKKDIINNAKNMMLLYIDTKLTSNYFTNKEFFKKYHISSFSFNKYVKITEKYFIDLFKQYQNIDRIVVQIKAIEYKEKIMKLLQELKFGKIDQGVNRSYDSIDLIMDFNNHIRHLYQVNNELFIQRKISYDDFKLINSFIGKIGYQRKNVNNDNCYEEFSDNDIQIILEGYKEINCQRDEEGLPIKGTGRIITLEEKQSVLDYLDEQNIIKNRITYNDGINRIILGISFTNNQKKLTKK